MLYLAEYQSRIYKTHTLIFVTDYAIVLTVGMGRALLLRGDCSKDASRKPEDAVRGQADTIVCEAGAEQSRHRTATAR